MNSIVLYISLILTLFQNTIFNSNELNIVSKLGVIEQKISQQSDNSNHNFQNTVLIIDEENDDEISEFKNKLLARKIDAISCQYSKPFSDFDATIKFAFVDNFISLTFTSIFIINRVIRL